MLVSVAMENVRRFFKEHAPDHSPSEAMWEGLTAIPRTVSAILRGKAKPAYYLCPLDTGTGKTVTLSQTIRALRQEWPQFKDVGVVICAGRYEQIDALVRDMGLRESEFAVLVSDSTPEGRRLSQLGLGRERRNKAPILLTTHAMVERRLYLAGDGLSYPNRKNVTLGYESAPVSSWASASDFFYRGRPRQLRVWDETLLPGLPITLDRFDLFQLLSDLREVPKVADVVTGILNEFMSASDHGLIQLPDFAALAPLNEVLGGMSKVRREASGNLLAQLWMLSGSVARVRSDGPRIGNTLLDFRVRFPDHMKPCLVLDASARVRATYAHQRRDQGDLEFLPGAPKRYSQVTVHIHKGGAGKANLGRNYSKRLQDVADIVNAHPDGSCLVIHHKLDKSAGVGHVPSDLLDYLEPGKNPAFVQWGAHNGINDYRDRSCIIAASTYFLRPSRYEAIGRAASGVPASVDYPEADLDEIRIGEIKSDLLQALSRGRLRGCDGIEAHPAEVHVWAWQNLDMAELMRDVFPGATIFKGQMRLRAGDRRWTSRQERVWQYIEDHFAKGDEPLTFPQVYRSLGMKQANFSAVIRSSELAQRLLAAGLQITEGRPKTIVRASDVLAAFD